MDRRGWHGAQIERFRELVPGLELERLGLGQQRIGPLIFGPVDGRGNGIAQIGNLEQPHPLEQAEVASGDLCQCIRQPRWRDILASEGLDHPRQRLRFQAKLGRERTQAGVDRLSRATRCLPEQRLEIPSTEGLLDDHLQFGGRGVQRRLAFGVRVALRRNIASRGSKFLARGTAGGRKRDVGVSGPSRRSAVAGDGKHE